MKRVCSVRGLAVGLVVGVLLAMAAGSLPAAVITYVPITNDADSQIDTANSYTHLLDFGTNDGGALINGVQFRRSTVGDLPPHFTYTIPVNSGSRGDHSGNGNHNVSGQAVNLFRDMIYNGGNAAGGVATLGLSNLVPGYEYDLRIYTRAWTSGDTRTATLGFDTNNDGTPNDAVTINEDDATANPPGFAASNQAYAISYRFTAENPVANVTLTQHAVNYSWHLYGLSNEVVGGPALAVANASFEEPAVADWSYLSEGQLPGWNIGGTTDKVGVARQGSPWANNGVIPDGDQVGYIQASGGTGTLSQKVFGLEAGETYRLSYNYNARGGYDSPQIKVSVDGNVLQETLYANGVGGANPYFLGAYEFVAAGPTATLLFENTQTVGDSAVLLDAVRVESAAANGWRIGAWSDDATSGVDPSRHYSHAINVQSTSTATVNGVAFKPSGTGANPAEGAGGANYATSGMGQSAGRAHNITDLGSQALAVAFRHNHGDTSTSGFTLSGLLPGQTYETTVYGVAWDTLPTSRRATFSVNGSEPVTLEENLYDYNNGVRFTYRGQADENGQIALDVTPQTAGTWHYYAFSNAFIRPEGEMAAGVPIGGMIIGDAFAGSNGADNGLIMNQRAPDHANLPGANYVETGFNQPGAFNAQIVNGTARLGANAGAGISLESAGGYDKPPGVQIQADLSPGSLAFSGNDPRPHARGVGLGFYDFITDPGDVEVALGFTGLVLGPDGGLYAYQNTAGETFSDPIPFEGTFDPNAFYSLSYDVDFRDGSISNIFLDGSTADYRPLTTFADGWFDDDATRMAAFTGSSAAGGTFGFVDNFMVTAIPEPGTLLLLLSALVCGALVRRKR